MALVVDVHSTVEIKYFDGKLRTDVSENGSEIYLFTPESSKSCWLFVCQASELLYSKFMASVK